MNALEITQQGAVLTITLSRPDIRNAFNDEVIAEITAAFQDAASRAEVQALIERWLATPGYRAELERREGLHDEQAIRAHTREHIHAMQARADAVFNNFLDLVGRPQRRVVLPSREFGD